MNSELDQQLCERYPKIFKNRYEDMRTTAMCWGFDCGDGWFNIIDALCAEIQSHIEHTRRVRAARLRRHRARARAQARGSLQPIMAHLARTYSRFDPVEAAPWMEAEAHRIMQEDSVLPPPACPQVVAVQVKEKYGTLRFYYDGGDALVDGLVRMAESMSAKTCEICGDVGKVYDNRWVTTRCAIHAPDAPPPIKRTAELKAMDGTDDLYFELTPEELKTLGWSEGDELQWRSNNDGSWTVKKKDASS